MRFAGKGYRPRVNCVFLGQLFSGGEWIRLAINFGMPDCPFNGLLIMGKNTFYPFVVEEAWAINVLVEHACRQIFRQILDECHV